MSKASKVCLRNPRDVISIQIQSLGVAGNVPGHAAQRQPVTVHRAAGAGALRRARLRRHLTQDRQHQPQRQGQCLPAKAAHLPPPPPPPPRPLAPGVSLVACCSERPLHGRRLSARRAQGNVHKIIWNSNNIQGSRAERGTHASQLPLPPCSGRAGAP